MKYLALCHTCRYKHVIDFDPLEGPGNSLIDWYIKHPYPHVTEFRYPQRRQREGNSRKLPKRWGAYVANADVKVAYGASTQPTMTLASLAASSTLLAGRESAAVDNGASNKYLDYLVGGNYKSAASNNQAGSIYTCVVAVRDDTPTWPDVFDGTESVETVSKQGVFDQICKYLSTISADNTSSQVWYWGLASVASCFSGFLPDQFVYFITHNIQTSTNVWSATEGDHAIRHTPVYATVI